MSKQFNLEKNIITFINYCQVLYVADKAGVMVHMLCNTLLSINNREILIVPFEPEVISSLFHFKKEGCNQKLKRLLGSWNWARVLIGMRKASACILWTFLGNLLTNTILLQIPIPKPSLVSTHM